MFKNLLLWFQVDYDPHDDDDVTVLVGDDVTYAGQAPGVDGCRVTGQNRTVSLLCLPIHNLDGEVIAVCSVYNKNNTNSSPDCFTDDDEKVS